MELLKLVFVQLTSSIITYFLDILKPDSSFSEAEDDEANIMVGLRNKFILLSVNH